MLGAHCMTTPRETHFFCTDLLRTKASTQQAMLLRTKNNAARRTRGAPPYITYYCILIIKALRRTTLEAQILLHNDAHAHIEAVDADQKASSASENSDYF